MFRPDQEYKCFATEGWATMGHIITDYRWLFYYAIRMEHKAALLEQETGNLQLQLVIWRDNTKSAELALDKVTGLLDKEHAYRLDSEKSERFELWVWRVGTVVALVAAGAFGAAWGVESR